MDAKDYIKETSPNMQTIINLAYWLTPEGLNNPINAALLRKSIESATDEEFKESFNGATKDEAIRCLEQWELCYMSHWGAPELARAIILSDTGRNETLVLRAVRMSQEIGELHQLFTPKTGIKWAMGRDYLINGSICKFVGVQPGNYGHPSNPLPIDDIPAAMANPEPGFKIRKKLKPLQRETNEALLLIYKLTETNNIEYLDELPATKAWGLITSKKFTSDLIKNISGVRGTARIELNGGETLDKKDFSDKYRKRFL